MANSVLVDNQFWLQAMGDHAIIIYENLAPVEAKEIKKAEGFITQLNDLLAEARENLEEEQVRQLIAKALKVIKEFRDFKLHLLARMITGYISITLTSAILNHMVNEADEYIMILGLYTNNTVPKFHPLHYDLVWLMDAIGHASVIESYSSYPFFDVANKSASFVQQFTILNHKAVEFAGYLRTGIQDFKALDKLNRDAFDQMRLFAEFSVDLELGISSKSIVIPITVLFLDHMYREECYYLTQLAIATNQHPPACDPAAPRKILTI